MSKLLTNGIDFCSRGRSLWKYARFSMKKLIFLVNLFLIILVLSLDAFAQVNVETLRQEKAEKGFVSQFTFKFQNMGGNSRAKSYSLGLRSDYFISGYHAFLIADYQRAESGGNDYSNKGLIHLRGQRAFSNHIALEGFTQKNFNDFIYLDDRILFGGGFRFTPFPELEGIETHLGIGLMAESEYYQNNLEETKRLLRSTNYVSLKTQITEHVILTGTGYYQPDVSDFDDFRVIGEGSLGYKLNELVILSLDGNCRYDSQPLRGVKKLDWKYLLALSLLF